MVVVVHQDKGVDLGREPPGQFRQAAKEPLAIGADRKMASRRLLRFTTGYQPPGTTTRSFLALPPPCRRAFQVSNNKT